ncbi:hypothetical protein ABPG74_016096 [Tetrahymena malaccensis]
MEIEEAQKIFTNVNIQYYCENLNSIKKNFDLQEIKEKLDQPEMVVKNKKELSLTRSKSIKKVYQIKVLRNKKNPQKILYKLDLVGQTQDKFDFIDYKDIFFEQPISTKQLVDSFKEEVVESIQQEYQPQKKNPNIKKKNLNDSDNNVNSDIQNRVSRLHSEEIQNQKENLKIEGEAIKIEFDNQTSLKQLENKSPFLKDEVNPRVYHYCIQPQSFMKNYKLNKLEFFRENLNYVQRQQRQRNIFQSIQVSFDDPQIPLQTNYNLDSFQDDQLYQIMKGLFDQKPIWIRNSLIVYLNKRNIKYTLFNFRKALAMLTYNFKDGPWKHAYVKFGYNPKENQEAVHYQVIDIVVLDREDYEQAKEYNPIQNTYDPTYIEKPQHYRHMYMLCEIKDENVNKFFQKALEKLKDPKDKIVPCKKSGWLQSIDIKRIQKLMKDKFKFN